VWECVFVGVTGRDCAREGVRAREKESVCEREGVILGVNVCERERECVCVYVYVYVYVYVHVHVYVYVYVYVYVHE